MMIRTLSVVAGLALAAAANANVILLDQIGASPAQVTGTANASQDFEPSFDRFDVAMIDDFTTTQAYTITNVEGVFTGFGGPTGTGTNYNNILGWRVEFYSSPAAAAASLTGDVASTTVGTWQSIVNPYTASPRSALVNLDVSGANINLGAGTYWMAIIPMMNFTPDFQIGVNTSLIPGGANTHQANPGGGFAIPGNLANRNADSAYRITAVPTPGALALLGLGGLAAARRRR